MHPSVRIPLVEGDGMPRGPSAVYGWFARPCAIAAGRSTKRPHSIDAQALTTGQGRGAEARSDDLETRLHRPLATG
jgi:hypothetical protein